MFEFGDSLDIGALVADPTVTNIGAFSSSAADLDGDGAADDILVTVAATVGGSPGAIDIVRLIEPAGLAGTTLSVSGDILTFA